MNPIRPTRAQKRAKKNNPAILPGKKIDTSDLPRAEFTELDCRKRAYAHLQPSRHPRREPIINLTGND